MTSTTSSTLIAPHGGTLVNLIVPDAEREALTAYAGQLPYIQLSQRQVCDLELLAVGAFSPLDRFMGQADHQRVLDEMRLANDALFPIPVTLPVDPGPEIVVGQDLALRDAKNNLLAVMTIEEAYEWDRDEVAQKAFGSLDLRHPLVAEMHRWGPLNISGPLRVIQLPPHYDFKTMRQTPAETRELLAQTGHHNVVAFQTRNPLHRVHEELTKRAV